MKWLGRLGAAFLLSAALFAGAPVAQAQQANPGQLAPCPLGMLPKIVTGTSYRVTTGDRCQFVAVTNTGTVTIELPAPGLIFQPGFEVKIVPTAGGTLTFTNLQDQAGATHKVNLGSTLTITAGTGADLQILQDMNWWAALLGGASVGTVQSVALTMPGGFNVANSPVTSSGTLAVTAASTAAHLFIAGPTSASAPWSFRAIDPTDLPALACAGLSNAGTACQANTGTSGHNLPFLDGVNTFSGTQTFGAVLGTIITDSTTARTLASSDCGQEINFTNAGAVAVTMANSLPAGCHIALRQGGAGSVTPSAAGGATINSPHAYTKTFAQFSIIGLSVVSNAGGSSAVADFVGDGT